MFELLRVNTMCGVCCVSMKVVVAIDLIATMILPASYCYAMYLIFLVFFEDLPVSTVLLILYAIIMGVQVVVFILRSRWDYIWWFLIYFTVGLPVFYLVLPVYSFWNMDDFSWGKTRAVGGSAAANAAPVDEEEDDDEEDEKERLYNNRGGRDRDEESYDSRQSGYSRGSRTSRGSNGSGDRSYDSRTYNSRSYRSRDQGSVGSGSRSSRGSTRDSRMNF
jgi:chitin synthase